MRRDLANAARVLVLPTLALVLVVALAPGRVSLAVRVYALVAGAVALGLALAGLRRAYPAVRPLRPSPPKPEPVGRPTTLARLENEAYLGLANAFELHHRLAPRLRALAAGLLASRRRVSLDHEPEKARRLLGAETWELVRPDRQPPTDRQARGLPREALARVVSSLEDI